MELQNLRQEIDGIDGELTALFVRRMELAAEIAAYKKENGLPIPDAAREEQKLQEIACCVPTHLQNYATALYTQLFALSRDYQARLSEQEER